MSCWKKKKYAFIHRHPYSFLQRRLKRLHNFWLQKKGITNITAKARGKPVVVFRQQRSIFQGRFSFIWSHWVKRSRPWLSKLNYLDSLSTQSDDSISCSYELYRCISNMGIQTPTVYFWNNLELSFQVRNTFHQNHTVTVFPITCTIVAVFKWSTRPVVIHHSLNSSSLVFW